MFKTLLSFLPHILIGAGGLAVIIHSVIEKEKASAFWKRITSYPTCFEFFGGTAVVIGTFWLAIQQADFEKDLTSKITGGDGYCYLQFDNYKSDNNLVDVFLKCEGKYPLYDLVIQVDDWEKVRQATQHLMENQPTKSIIEASRFAAKDSLVRSMGTILPRPNSARLFEVFKLPTDDLQRYFISITARNGAIAQYVRFQRVHGIWLKAEKVQRGDEVIHELVDDDFPRGPGGSIDWND